MNYKKKIVTPGIKLGRALLAKRELGTPLTRVLRAPRALVGRRFL